MPEKPNIVMVVLDTARAKNISCYGYDRKTTPFLDEIAENNIKYEHAVSQANWTLPSHASMFTGKYISEHEAGQKMSFDGLDMVQEELKEKGYRTIGIPNVAYLSEEFDFAQYFDDFRSVEQTKFRMPGELSDKDFDRRRDKYTSALKHYLGKGKFGELAEGASYVLRKHFFMNDSGAKKTNKIAKQKLSEVEDEPFFLFLNYVEPHTPYMPPFPYSHKFLDDKFSYKSVINASNHIMRKYLSEKYEPDQELLEIRKSLYDGEINYLDSRLEKLHHHIEEKYPNTVFIYLSDHGEYHYEHKRVNHAVGLHEEVTHVPLIESFPEDSALNEQIGENVELRQLRNHLSDLSEGNLKPIEPKDTAISEDFGVSSALFDRVSSLSKEEHEKLSRYIATACEEDKKLFYYSDGEKQLKQLPQETELQDEVLQKKLSKKIVNLIGRPEEKSQNEEEKEVEDEKIKDKLADLGYM